MYPYINGNWRPNEISGVQPFTFRDDYTFLEILRELWGRIERDVFPMLNELEKTENTNYAEVSSKFKSLSDEWNNALKNLDPTEVGKMIDTLSRQVDETTKLLQQLKEISATNSQAQKEISAQIATLQESKAVLATIQNKETALTNKIDENNRLSASANDLLNKSVDSFTKANNLNDNATQTLSRATAVSEKTYALRRGETTIAAFFRNNNETCRFAMSSDGINFEETGIEYYLPSSEGTIRDPSIAIIDGVAVLAITNGKMQFVTSDSDRHWTLRNGPDFRAKLPALKRVWAADWYIDGNMRYLIFAGSTETNGDNSTFKMYESHCNGDIFNVNNWSTPALMTATTPSEFAASPNVVGIDGHIVKLADKKYVMIYSNAVQRLSICESTTPIGPWSNLRDLDKTIDRGEGPCVIPLIGGGYRLYWDSTAWLFMDSCGAFCMDFDENFDKHSNPQKISLPMMHFSVVNGVGNKKSDALTPFTQGSRFRAGGTIGMGSDKSFDCKSDKYTVVPFTTYNGSIGCRSDASQIIAPANGWYVISGQITAKFPSGKGAWFQATITQRNQPLPNWYGSGSSDAFALGSDMYLCILSPTLVYALAGDDLGMGIIGPNATLTAVPTKSYLSVVMI